MSGETRTARELAALWKRCARKLFGDREFWERNMVPRLRDAYAAELARARNLALEEAAREVEETGRALVVDDNPRRACYTAAARIRALKTP